jgi:hypothetical protein
VVVEAVMVVHQQVCTLLGQVLQELELAEHTLVEVLDTETLTQEQHQVGVVQMDMQEQQTQVVVVAQRFATG